MSRPAASALAPFDAAAGSRLERLIFERRRIIVALCCVATLLLGWSATSLRLNARFEDAIPADHPYIVNYREHKRDLGGLENTLRIALEAPAGATVFDRDYLEALRSLTDKVYLLPGADRPFVKSLWTSSTRWIGVTKEGMDGGPVIPDDYDGSARSLATVRRNLERSGEIGRLIAPDFRSGVILLPLQEKVAATGEPLDYRRLSQRLEEIREKYRVQGYAVHIVGFAKVVGDLMDGLGRMTLFFAVTVALAVALLSAYARCARSAFLTVACSLTAVVWLLGTLPLLGRGIDPYSMIVPFLVFAVGMSHGAQKMNGVAQDVGLGADKLTAARRTFRRLFTAGLAALLADAAGFMALRLVPIKVVQDLALTAGVGVAILIFTNLVLLPVLLSFTGVSRRAAAAARARDLAPRGKRGLQRGLQGLLERFTRPVWAAGAVGSACLLGAVGWAAGGGLKIGDPNAGAPELRADSRYNLDSAFIAARYGAGGDVFIVMVKTPPGACNRYSAVAAVDALAARLQQIPGVARIDSLADLSKRLAVAQNEGAAKWWDVPRNQDMLGFVVARSPRELFNPTCDLLIVNVFLQDRKADTLAAVSRVVEDFAAAHNTGDAQFLPAAGDAGIEAAVNVVVEDAGWKISTPVYLSVALLCFAAFRSWRAVVCAIIPLMLTAVLCKALMAALGIGMKVATLPAITLGVGVGVDYAFYILSAAMAGLRRGRDVSQAFSDAFAFTGRVTLLTGATLSLGVAAWALSPIQFQADMGVLLAFMFGWNMIGALVLGPALACFLFRGAGAAAGENR